MIQFKKFVFNPFQENTYLVFDETREAVIIDPGCYSQQEVETIKQIVDSDKLRIKFLVNTHCHIDHILGIYSLKELFKVKSLAHEADRLLMQTATQQAMIFGLSLNGIPQSDENIYDGDKIHFGNSYLQVIHTPGHTPGCISLYSPEHKIVFTGDTLFNQSIGRTDLAGGDYDTIINSIKNKLLILEEDISIYPGHGDASTIGNEKKHNPFLN